MFFANLQLLHDLPIACIDTETTGASAAYGHKVIEVGIVRIESGREVGRYQQLIDPRRRISAGVTAFTGITQEMVAGQPRFRDQLGAMLQILKGAAILGHNIRFDLSFLHHEFRRARLDMCGELGDIPIFDTVRIARRRFGRGGNALSLLSRRLGIDPGRSHRALPDAVATAAVFEQLLAPVGGYACCLCDALEQQGGAIDLAKSAKASMLPLELEEAIEAGKEMLLEYIDLFGNRTERVVLPMHLRKRRGNLMQVAFCRLRGEERTFKLDRIVRLSRIEDGWPISLFDDVRQTSAAKIYDAPEAVGARIYDAPPQPVELSSLSNHIDMAPRAGHAPPLQPPDDSTIDLTTAAIPS